MQKSQKYRVLAEAQQCGYRIRFKVLYAAHATTEDEIAEEIGQKEGELIRLFLPPLNSQIPKEHNWHEYYVNPAVRTMTMKQLLE